MKTVTFFKINPDKKKMDYNLGVIHYNPINQILDENHYGWKTSAL